MPCTLSMEACKRPTAMKRGSLIVVVSHEFRWRKGKERKKEETKEKENKKRDCSLAYSRFLA